MAAPKKKAVAKRGGTDVAVVDFGNDVGAGMEGTDAESFAIPFLGILQKGSPQVDEDDGAFIKGAKQSMFFNSVTEELFDGKKGVRFIPCAYQRRFIRWGARKQGGGFKGEYTPKQVEELRASGDIKDVNGKLLAKIDGQPDVWDPDINDGVKDTRNHFGLVETANGWQQVLLSLASTQIKKSRGLMSMMNQIRVNGQQPPTFYNVVHCVTIPESNDQGSWHGIKFAIAGAVPSQEVYDEAKAFNDAIVAGKANVNYASQEPTDGDVDADGKF